MSRLLFSGIFLLVPTLAFSQTTFLVSTESELRTALTTSAAGDTIRFIADIGLTADLPSVSRDLTIDGGGFTLSGNNQFRGLFVAGFDTSGVALTKVSVSVQNLTFADTVAVGGAGGSGAAGGGGGAGLGGALYVADQATVTLSNVRFVSSAAIGGAGGAGELGLAGGGGGGLGGDGGSGATSVTGAGPGGGGVGQGADGGAENLSGAAGILQGAGAAGFTSGDGSGGVQAGGGAGGWDVEPETGGGGGAVNGFSADGGFGGGGGGGYSGGGDGGAGGFGGGGGGGVDGFGGFGGGSGGSNDINTNVAGVFGGSGGTSTTGNGGGGGAGLGGAVFVQEGGTIVVSGSVSIDGSSVTGGAGGTGAQGGAAYGAGLFLQGFGTLALSPAAGQMVSIGDAIADQDGTVADPEFPGVWTLVKGGAGSLVLGGFNRYSGDTFLNAGTLSISSDANLGTGGTLHLADATTLQITSTGTFNRGTVLTGQPTFAIASGQTATWSGLVQESLPGAGVVITGGGALALTNTGNQYSGGTFVSGRSRVLVGADAALGAAGGGLTLGDAVTGGGIGIFGGASFSSGRAVTLNAGGGTIDVPGSAAATFFGGLTGPGTLTKTGAGTLTLASANAYSGGTTIQQGVLAAGAANAFGSGGMAIEADGTLDLNGFDQSFGLFTGAGEAKLTSASLTVGVGSTSSTFSGELSGSGGLVKVGDGTLSLTGSASYTGGTAVLGGTLSGNAASLRGVFEDDSLLVFVQPTDASFDGTLNGQGSLHKLGAGTLTLSGDHGFTGTTTVSQGGLLLNGGSIGGSIVVAPGATLQASGSIGGSVDSSGTLFIPAPPVEPETASTSSLRLAATAPGGPALTIGGTLVANPGSVIGVTVGQAVAPVQVDGRALLNGAVLDVDLRGEPTSERVTSFPAITAVDGVVMQDTTVTTREPSLLPVSLRNSPTAVFVTLVNLAPPLTPVATTPNAVAVGTVVDRVKLDSTGDLRAVIGELTALDDESLDRALSDIAGEIYGSQIQLALMDADIITDMVREEIADRDRYAGSAERLHWWGQLSGEHATFDGRDGLRSAAANVGGGAGGFDWRPSDRWFFGGGGGYSNGTMRLAGPGGVSTLLAPRAFGYGGFMKGRVGVNFGASTARVSSSTTRQIVFTAKIETEQGEQPLSTGIDRQANSDQLGQVSDAWGEYNDTLTVNDWSVNWNVGVRRVRFGRDGWAENGAGALALTALDQVLNLTQTDVKLRLWKKEGVWRPHFASSYRRELSDGETSTLLLLGGDPDADFTIDGIAVPGNAFMGRAGITRRLGFLGEVTLDYEYRHAAGQTRQSVDLRYRFQ